MDEQREHDETTPAGVHDVSADETGGNIPIEATRGRRVLQTRGAGALAALAAMAGLSSTPRGPAPSRVPDLIDLERPALDLPDTLSRREGRALERRRRQRNQKNNRAAASRARNRRR